MSLLILTLPLARPGPGTIYRYTLTADGLHALRHESAAAALLPASQRGGETVAVVPIQALSWHRVILPPGLPLGTSAAVRVRNVLEGLLEDQLLDEPSQLHFALAPETRAGATTWVAVCDRVWLREHLQALEAAGRRPSRVVPEFAPGGPAQAWALGTPEDAWLVRTGLGPDQGLAWLPLSSNALSLWPDAETATGAVQAEPAVAALTEQRLGQPVTLQTADQRALESARSPWDLAQFDLASTGRTRLLRAGRGLLRAGLNGPQWRAARWATGLILGIHLVGLNAAAWQEQAMLKAKQAAVRSTLTQTFPQVAVVVDAPVQMARELALLRQTTGSAGTQDFEPLLAAAGAALADGPQATGLEFSAGRLRLNGVTLPADRLEAAQSRVQALGFALRAEDGALTLRPEGPP